MRLRVLAWVLAFGMSGAMAGWGGSIPAAAQDSPNRRVLEPGYEAVVYVAGIAGPTAIDFGPDGNLYVTTVDGNVYRVRDTGAGSGRPPELVVTGLSQPTGMAFGADGLLYLPTDDGDTSTPEQPRSMVLSFDVVGATLPLALSDGRAVLHHVPTGIHPLGGLARGPGDLMYVSVGSASLNGDSAPGEVAESEPLTMGVFRFDPSDVTDEPLDPERYRGSGADPEHPIDVVAHGIHNPADLTFTGGHLFTASNAPQGQEPLGEDHIIRVADVARRSLASGTALDFGSPGCLWRTGRDGRPVSGASDYPSLPDSEKTCEGRAPVLATIGLHTGPTGIATAPPTFGSGANDVFVALWGNLIPTADAIIAGHEVIRVGVDAAGEPQRGADCVVEVEDFLAGGSPIDVAFHDGEMFVADMALGGVLKITVAADAPTSGRETDGDAACSDAAASDRTPRPTARPGTDTHERSDRLPATGAGIAWVGPILVLVAASAGRRRFGIGRPRR